MISRIGSLRYWKILVVLAGMVFWAGRLDMQIDSLDARVARGEEKVDGGEETVDRLEEKVDLVIETRVDGSDGEKGFRYRAGVRSIRRIMRHEEDPLAQ